MFFSLVIYFYGDKGTKHFLISNKKCEPHGREKISKLGNEKISKCGGLRSSKDNGEERKRAEKNFDEKRL